MTLPVPVLHPTRRRDDPVDWAIVTDRNVLDDDGRMSAALRIWSQLHLRAGRILTVREEPLDHRRIYEVWEPRR